MQEVSYIRDCDCFPIPELDNHAYLLHNLDKLK
jgi:hypothetical protein